MKSFTGFCLLALALSFTACRHSQPEPSPTDALVGTWQLTNLVCYCPANWRADEQLLFADGQRYQRYEGGKLVSEGTYTVGQGQLCSKAASTSLLQLVPSSASTYAPSGAYSLQGNQLIIDQGAACLADAAVSTYKRL